MIKGPESPARCHAPFIRALLCWTGVVLAGMLANRTESWPLNALFLLAALGLPWLVGPQPPRRLALASRGWVPGIALGAGAICLPSLILWLVIRLYFQALFLHPTGAAAMSFLGAKTASYFPVAVAEEFFFRGYLQETVLAVGRGGRGCGPVTRKNLAASLLFGAAHAVVYLNPLRLVSACAGLVFGWLMEHSDGSIWPAVCLHLAANVSLAWTVWLIGLNLPA